MYKINKNAKDKNKEELDIFIYAFNFMEGIDIMIKQMAWNTFKNTGDINTFLELVQVENVEKNIIEAEKQNGNIEIKGNSNSGKQYERL